MTASAGVASPPPDEYDRIRDSLIGRLLRGAGRIEIAAFLRQELEESLGMPPDLVTTALIDRIIGWWESVP